MTCKMAVAMLILLSAPCIKAQTDESAQPEYNLQVRRSFRASNSATVDITNKYGLVQVTAWDKDSVSFTIDLSIRARDDEKLQELKNSIDFNFSSGQYFIVAQTSISQSGPSLIQDLIDLAGRTFAPGTSTVSINYQVQVPAYMAIKIDNRFGDVYCDDLNGNLNLNLSYGDFKSNQLGGKSDIKVSSGDIDINYVKDGQVKASYSDIHIRRADRLYLESVISGVTIDRVSDLRLESRRDKIFLGEVGSMNGNSYFTDFRIDVLTGRIDFNMQYGELVAEDIRKGFSVINLASEYTDVDLRFERPLSFAFDMRHHRDALFNYPAGLATLNTVTIDANERLMRTSGYFGTDGQMAMVNISAPRKCNIAVSYK